MPAGSIDPRWPKLLSLTAHEFRSPLTVVAGYIRMLLKERAGPLPEQQRRLLEEAEKSCARLSGLLAEVSELSQLEAQTAPFNRSPLDVATLLADVIAQLPDLPDRTVTVALAADAVRRVNGDAVRLKSAFTGILSALRRELVTSDRLDVRVEPTGDPAPPAVRITIADAVRMDEVRAISPTELSVFDEWRGGNGLSLVNARRVIEAHGGELRGASDDGKAVAIITLPTN